MKLAGWIGLALSIAPFSTFAASIRDTVLYCNNGSPCTILSQSTTGPAVGSSSLFSGTVSGSADATGAILRASSSYNFTASAPQNGQVNGNAQFFDQLTINDAGLTGTIGYLVPTFAVTGSVSGPADAVVGFLIQGCTPTGPIFCQTTRVTGNSMVSFNPIAFTFGQPFSFEMDFGTEAFYGPGGGLNAAANFSHALLNGLHVFQNSDGTNPVPSQNLTFTSSGDVSYSVNGIVPEPASVLLIVSGLACIAAISRKRKTL
jgi:hypothetical protein